jgi:hypothetical protein
MKRTRKKHQRSGYWLAGNVDWPERAGLPGVVRKSCVFEHLDLRPGRLVATEVPWEVCASNASTGIDARCGGPDVRDASGGHERGGRCARQAGSRWGSKCGCAFCQRLIENPLASGWYRPADN